MKINLNTKILTIRGKPIEMEEPIRGASNDILNEIAGYPITNPEDLSKKLTEWQKKLKETTKRDMTIRDSFLTILGQRFDIKDRKEIFWTTELGIVISNDKNKEAEISGGKLDFLKRIVENNKIKQQSPMGEKEVELFFPNELGQILIALEGEEEKKDK